VDVVCTRKYWIGFGRNGESSKVIEIKVTGGKQHERFITRSVVTWCKEYFHLNSISNINIRLEKHIDCWGYCLEGKEEHSYNIKIATNQKLRDFIATIVHEMVHVMQWETGTWSGEGEREANKLQYKLTDKLWEDGIL
tara:strand:- start:479 stop:892 length:414 start_codon:yes stop_codon:yes gene_type:complete